MVTMGRMSANLDGDFVVFLVGLHINKPLRPGRWMTAVRAGRSMDSALRKDSASGMLNSRLYFGSRGPMFAQIWRSFEDLERFARQPGEAHRKAWAQFNRTVGKTGEVGL